MFATCLFCSNALGRNAALEHFPVGRRLAYDPVGGRLWVVCATCQQWNLSPLESRWEAIDDAERLFRATRMRASTDNIGLARLTEGTELVRVGKALLPEFAGWRYGDVLGKRYRKQWIWAGGSLAAAAGSTGYLVSSVSSGPEAFLGPALFGIMAVNAANAISGVFSAWRGRRKISTTVRDDDGKLLHLTLADASSVAMVSTGHTFDWKLKVPRNRLQQGGGVTRLLGVPQTVRRTNEHAFLRGDSARRALATILPQVNVGGASRRGVSEAIATIDNASNIENLLRLAAETRVRPHHDYMDSGESMLQHVPSPLRLALEISLHADDEKRAMEGELRELEQRWRDADAIARIADALLLPEAVDAQLRALQTERDSASSREEDANRD